MPGSFYFNIVTMLYIVYQCHWKSFTQLFYMVDRRSDTVLVDFHVLARYAELEFQWDIEQQPHATRINCFDTLSIGRQSISNMLGTWRRNSFLRKYWWAHITNNKFCERRDACPLFTQIFITFYKNMVFVNQPWNLSYRIFSSMVSKLNVF